MYDKWSVRAFLLKSSSGMQRSHIFLVENGALAWSVVEVCLETQRSREASWEGVSFAVRDGGRLNPRYGET